MDREHSIDGRRMKSQDPIWTDRSEGGALVHLRESRTKAIVVMAIRDRRSFSSKLCRHSLSEDGEGRNLSVRALGKIRSQD